MKKRILLGLGALGHLLVGGVSVSMAGSPSIAPHVKGEILVKLKKGEKKLFLEKSKILGLNVRKELNLLAGEFLLLRSDVYRSSDLVAEIKSFPEIEYVEPNFIYKIVKDSPNIQEIVGTQRGEKHSNYSPADPMYSKLWGLDNRGNNEPTRSGETSRTPGVVGADISAEQAWTITQGSKDVVVAVIDTGIDYQHPDLQENMWVNEGEIPGNGIDDDENGYIDDVYGWNAQADHGDPMDGHDHGTHCAGTIGARHNNGIGVAGVMNDVRLMAVKFLSDSGSGTLADAVEAIDYATKMKVDIMSNSWGGGGFSQALEDSIKRANEEGILFVAAAGNSSQNNDSSPSYPASYQVENVISVASATAQDTLSSFSNYGRRKVHVAAPGSNILSTTKQNNYKVFSGTSMATPHVSGVLGLFLAEQSSQDLSIPDIKRQLLETSVPTATFGRKVQSGGRVNAYHLLTDHRIPREGPQDGDWRTVNLEEVFETSHPYLPNARLSQTYTFPGAKYVRLVISRYETENLYDFIKIKNSTGALIESIAGSGENLETDYIEGESITVEFTSDGSVHKWGVLIENAQVIYE